MKVAICAASPFAEPLCDAILISSNQRMKMGGGLSGAVHRLAGPRLRAHCDDLPPLLAGTAIVTPGFDCPFPWIIHAYPGNNFTHVAPWSCLATTLLAALEAAESAQLRSVSMSAFGTGSAQIPTVAAANITMRALSEAGVFKHLDQVKFYITDRLVRDTYIGAARLRNLIARTTN